MTLREAIDEAAKHKIDDYRHRGVKLQGITFFPVKFEAHPHPDKNGTNHEVLVELEVVSGENIKIPLQDYFQLLNR